MELDILLYRCILRCIAHCTTYSTENVRIYHTVIFFKPANWAKPYRKFIL